MNVWVCAPPRTGKTRGVIFPTLLADPPRRGPIPSIVMHDIRGEGFEMTGYYRGLSRSQGGLGSRVLYYNPTTKYTHRHNPLDEIRLGDNEVRDTRNIVDMHIDPNANKDDRDHWDRAVSPTITSTILHILYSKPAHHHNMEAVAYYLADAERHSIKEALDEMRTTNHLGSAPHPVIASMAQELLQKSPNDLSGVISTAMDYVGDYRDPLIAHLTRTSDFRIAELQFGPQPVSLYMVIPPSDLAIARPILRIFWNQLTSRLMEDYHAKNRRPLDLIFDEFNSLGKLDFLKDRAAYLAGYRMRCVFVNQSVPQLHDTWGVNEPITPTCAVKVAFTASDVRSARAFVELLSKTTKMRKQVSYSGDRFGWFLGRKTTSESEVEAPLLSEAELLQLSPAKALVFVDGAPRFLIDKIDFDRDPFFQRRLGPPPKPLMPYDEPLPPEPATAPVTPPPATPRVVDPGLSPESEWEYVL
jgi:type IV secretion system protein VirD4